jgi:hypothetical protein
MIFVRHTSTFVRTRKDFGIAMDGRMVKELLGNSNLSL